MKQLVVISGKGGTGKTTVVGSFAALAERPVLADCDVDAADLDLLLAPTVQHTEDFTGPLRPEFDKGVCTGCGLCVERCAFSALAHVPPRPRTSAHGTPCHSERSVARARNLSRQEAPATGDAPLAEAASPERCFDKLSMTTGGRGSLRVGSGGGDRGPAAAATAEGGCATRPVPRLDTIACEGCALCSFLCPVQAITMRQVVAGRWFVSDTRFGPLVHARLGVAQENSGKLVTLVRNRATEIAEERAAPWLLIDGSPGIGCPVIASLAGADAVLIVAEPTLSGKSDLARAARLAAHFSIPALVCVNKWDINEALTDEIEAESEAAGCRIAGRIPYDDAVPRSIVQGVPLVEHDDGPASQALRALWDRVAKG